MTILPAAAGGAHPLFRPVTGSISVHTGATSWTPASNLILETHKCHSGTIQICFTDPPAKSLHRDRRQPYYAYRPDLKKFFKNFAPL